jgi:hypothetical protein
MICKGKILDLIHITDEVIQVVIQAKKNETFFPVAFIAFRDIKVLINQVKIEKGDVVKIDYYIKSKKWDNKYTTSAIVDKIKILSKKPSQLYMDIDMETGEIIG